MAPAKKKAKENKVESANSSTDSKSDVSTLLGSILGTSDLGEVVGRRSDVSRRSLFKKKDAEELEDLKNDDEREKEERRKAEAEKEKEKTSKPVAANILSKLSPQELEEHYSKCINLCNQNKVNPKNAFKLQLIDYMKTIWMNQPSKSDNLSLMGYTLDASAKIYSCRVDKVYSDMLNAMSGKDWGKKSKDSDDEDEKESKDGDGGSEEEKDDLKKKKKKMDRDSDTEDETDICFDSCKMIGKPQQFRKSKLEKDYYGITLPFSQEYFVQSRPCAPNGALSILSYSLFEESTLASSENYVDLGPSHPGPTESLKKTDFIPEYKNLFKDYSTDDSTRHSRLLETSLTIDPTTSLNPDFLMNGIDNDSVDPGDHCYDYDDEIINHQAQSKHIPFKANIKGPMSFSVADMSKMVSAASNDYSYFHESKITFWAGPSHWRLKPSKAKEMKANEAKASKKSFNINFSFENVLEVANYFNDTVDAKLAKKTMCTWSKSKCTYPPPMNYEQRHILRFFKNRDISYMKKTGDVKVEDNDDECNDNGVLRPNDFEVAPDDHFDDDNCDAEAPSEVGDNGNTLLSGTFSEDNPEPPNLFEGDGLLPAPPKVHQVAISFAKAQKKIDVKLLKQTMWTIMDLESNSKENLLPPENDISISASSDKKRKLPTAVKLSEVFRELPKKLPPEEVEELSFPIAFMALLHMANEKTLELKGNIDYSDIEVTMSSAPTL